MDWTNRFTEGAAVLAYDQPYQRNAGTRNSSYVSMMNYHRAVLLLAVGSMANLATLDVAIRQATSTAGASNKAITSKAITQLTQASGDGDDLLAIELRTEELDVENGFDCINVRATVGVSNVVYGWWLLGLSPRFPPVSTTNFAEIVT